MNLMARNEQRILLFTNSCKTFTIIPAIILTDESRAKQNIRYYLLIAPDFLTDLLL